jgi:lipopolysaccharide transport system ATP-binding protein
MNTAISVNAVSKSYQVGVAGRAEYQTLRESIMSAAAGLGRGLRQFVPGLNGRGRGDRGGEDERVDKVWALKDVSFEVQRGEVLGIIGRNGAGKSTLLKILSRITHPTAGRIDLKGRIGSLLEVGTGFHPELTGRENIYLNGAILGMTRREVARKFDEIVAFAEVERFLDTPVKRYSSGMYMRLAFAVASHLEPDILVVDEVLAVGDMAFQKKCLGRMSEVSRHGRTVLFVSHNTMAVKSLCSRVILIENGRIAADGGVDEVVDKYLNEGVKVQPGVIPDNAFRLNDCQGEARFRSVRLTDLRKKEVGQIYFGQPFRVEFICDIEKDIVDGHFEVSISTLDGIQVTYSTTIDGAVAPLSIARGRHKVTATFDVVLLPRQYAIDLGVHHHDGSTADFVPRTLVFNVLRVAEKGLDHFRWPRSRGYVRATASWEFGDEAPASLRHPAAPSTTDSAQGVEGHEGLAEPSEEMDKLIGLENS